MHKNTDSQRQPFQKRANSCVEHVWRHIGGGCEQALGHCRTQCTKSLATRMGSSIRPCWRPCCNMPTLLGCLSSRGATGRWRVGGAVGHPERSGVGRCCGARRQGGGNLSGRQRARTIDFFPCVSQVPKQKVGTPEILVQVLRRLPPIPTTLPFGPSWVVGPPLNHLELTFSRDGVLRHPSQKAEAREAALQDVSKAYNTEAEGIMTTRAISQDALPCRGECAWFREASRSWWHRLGSRNRSGEPLTGPKSWAGQLPLGRLRKGSRRCLQPRSLPAEI